MGMKLKDVLKPLRKMAPEFTAEAWDNVGLQIGDKEQIINKALLTVDITDSCLEEAKEKGCELIISHHPLIFKPLKNLTASDYIPRLVSKAIKHGLAIYAMHTNLDLAEKGVNRALGDALGLKRGRGLVPSGYKEYVKVITFVPNTEVESIREALWTQKAGFIGNYDHCAFETIGTGRFRPLTGTNPYLGTVGKEEEVEEIRLETIINKEKYLDLIEQIKKIHPYEEPVIDVYPLTYPKESRYLGEFINLETPVDLETLLNRWGKKTLFYGAKDEFKRIAILGGSGSIGVEFALKNKADLFITGELDYHELIQAREEGLAVLLLGHGASEAPVLNNLLDIMPIEAQIASKPYLVTP